MLEPLVYHPINGDYLNSLLHSHLTVTHLYVITVCLDNLFIPALSSYKSI